MGKERGEGEDSGKLGVMGCVGGRKDGYGSREVYISTKGAILRFTRDLILEERSPDCSLDSKGEGA